MSDPLRQIAVDIETTGLAATDRLTVVGFAVQDGYRVLVQTDGRAVGEVESSVQTRIDEPVEVSTHPSEATLLDAVDVFVRTRLRQAERDVLLVAYNGETYRGGFDLPFLRTRCVAHDRRWPFRELPYADLYPIVRRLFNTTVAGDDHSDLESAYEVLGDGRYEGLDPFDDSAAAVEAFTAGELESLVVHNLADICRTKRLSELAQRYCSRSDFDLKSLTPTREGGE